ncbi:alpha/beta fold hydrolase [Govanella unica]|uniref:Alpha/beta hydrolase n=1 Tax=Govanella unica TaxID=2975056 RepID=A0A9X3TWH9_9PROT|nr:alpha/beta hydrolase [Govania unica]MDA5192864.1 alpha/beta hydrolase [Govania unica]
MTTKASRRRTTPEGAVFDWLTTHDGLRLRVAFWAAAGASRGTVLLLQGRREFIEKYDETIAELLDRGFAVATLDWRGQGLSDRLLPDRQRGHVGSFSDYVEDMRLFAKWAEARASGPYLLLAHSMGGHIAARYLAAGSHAITRAVLIAPMIGVRFGILPERVARFIAEKAVGLGRAGSFALLQGPYSETSRHAEAIVLSSDRERLEDEILLCRANPDLSLGGVTYGWVAAALQSIDQLRATGTAEAIQLPMLIIMAGRDQVVSNPETRAFAGRVQTARMVEIADARHEILKERDELRAKFWAAFDEFTA